MFQFPPFASVKKNTDNYPSGNWVVPFGNPGIKGHLHLHRAYRSLSRPSSPPRAKASTGRPNLLSPKSNTLPSASPHQVYSAFGELFASLILSAVIESLYINITQSLTYSLYLQSCVSICQRSHARKGDVENNGFEPLTPCLQSRCSSQLS